jgi:hypothetical protein
MDLFKAANFTSVINTKGNLPQDKLIMSQGVKLAELDAIYGKGTAKKLVILHLLDLADLLNFDENKKLNEFQLGICADNMLKYCRGITIPELVDMLRKFTSGKYGKFFAQMDIMAIGEWTRLYMRERGDIICRNIDVKNFLMQRDQNYSS